jgi:hypothetical protein
MLVKNYEMGPLTGFKLTKNTAKEQNSAKLNAQLKMLYDF